MATEGLEDRVKKLEHANRRHRLVLAGIGIAVLACATIWVLTGATSRAQAQRPAGTANIIRARGFVLEDDNGRSRAALSMHEGAAGLCLWDENGKLRAVLTDGPQLSLADENGELRAGLYVTVAGTGLTLSDEKGKTRAGLVVLKYGPELVLSDENGKPIWSAP